jgi:hypothetical protein
MLSYFLPAVFPACDFKTTSSKTSPSFFYITSSQPLFL